MNHVILLGHLTADPEIRSTQDGKAVGTYTIAVNRRFGDQKADFIRCQVWEKKAEFAEKYLKKGTKILVTGRIKTGSYTNRDGNKVYTTDVVVEDHEFAESKGESKEFAESKGESKDDDFVPVMHSEDTPFR